MSHFSAKAIMFHLHKQMSSEIKCFPFAYIYQSVPDHHLTGDEPGEESMTGDTNDSKINTFAALSGRFVPHWHSDYCFLVQLS